MKRLHIKTASFAQRCEICHQSDQFDPQTSICRRCHQIPYTLRANSRAKTNPFFDRAGIHPSFAPYIYAPFQLKNRTYPQTKLDEQMLQVGMLAIMIAPFALLSLILIFNSLYSLFCFIYPVESLLTLVLGIIFALGVFSTVRSLYCYLQQSREPIITRYQRLSQLLRGVRPLPIDFQIYPTEEDGEICYYAEVYPQISQPWVATGLRLKILPPPPALPLILGQRVTGQLYKRRRDSREEFVITSDTGILINA
jgi:hypothetical protein